MPPKSAAKLAVVGSPRDDLKQLIALWDADLQLDVAEGRKQPRTRQSYLESVRLLDEFLTSAGRPKSVRLLADPATGVEHLRAFFIDLSKRRTNRKKRGGKMSLTSLKSRHASLSAFFTWLAEQSEAAEIHAMKKVPAAKPDSEPRRILSVEEVRLLLAGSRGRTFDDLRDAALLKLMLFCMRVEEAGSLLMAHVDLDRPEPLISFLGKGNKWRHIPITALPATRPGEHAKRQQARQVLGGIQQALGWYLRARESHQYVVEPWLWLSSVPRRTPTGDVGRFTVEGVKQMVERRAKAAGLGHVTPHDLRATGAFLLTIAGVSESSIMSIAGWRSASMLRRYTEAARVELARWEVEGR